jgi:hypothetical protein
MENLLKLLFNLLGNRKTIYIYITISKFHQSIFQLTNNNPDAFSKAKKLQPNQKWPNSTARSVLTKSTTSLSSPLDRTNTRKPKTPPPEQTSTVLNFSCHFVCTCSSPGTRVQGPRIRWEIRPSELRKSILLSLSLSPSYHRCSGARTAPRFLQGF